MDLLVVGSLKKFVAVDELIDVDEAEKSRFQLPHVIFLKPSFVMLVAEVDEVLLDCVVSAQDLFQNCAGDKSSTRMRRDKRDEKRTMPAVC